MRERVRIGTRGSDLALWQARWVAERLEPVVPVEIVVITTRGDVVQDRPLQEVEGAAFFTAEIERALLEGEVDLAVHSHKDLETILAPGTRIAAVPRRADPAERLVLRGAARDARAAFLPLAVGARVGTSAPRRRAQLLAMRPDLEVVDLRGNVPTRVQRVRDGDLDATLLAAAGLDRLGLDLSDLVTVDLPTAWFVPAPGQAALGIQIREDDHELGELCEARLHHAPTAAAIDAERSLLTRLGGGCHLPLGAQARLEGEVWVAEAFLGDDLPGEAGPAAWSVGRGASPREAVDAAAEQVLGPERLRTGAGPLGGLSVSLVGSNKKGTVLGKRLASLGARVHHERVIEFQGVRAPDLPGRLVRLGEGDAVAVTSQEAARRLAGERIPGGVVVAAVGPATARALAAAGLRPTVVGKGGARALARNLELERGATVLFPCAEGARSELPEALEARGIHVDRVVLYRTVQAEAPDSVEPAEVRIYMSGSAVDTSLVLGREEADPAPLRVGLGTTTCDALRDAGLEHVRPAESGPEAVIQLLGQRSREGVPS